MRTAITLSTLLLASCASSSALIRDGAPAPVDAPPRGTEPMTNEAALVIYSAGADRLLADPRDAGLRRAFGSLDERLAELADDDPMAIEVLSLLTSIFSSPASLTVHVPESGSPPVRAQITVEPDGAPGAAAALEAELSDLLFTLGLEGMETPLGFVEHALIGAHDERVAVSIGGLDDSDLGLGSMDLPEGVEPLLAVRMDLSRVDPLLGMVADELGPEGSELMTMLGNFGIGGPDALQVTFAFGAEDGVGYMATRTGNYVRMMEKTGALETAPIEASELGMIPTDAVSAAVVQTNPSSFLNWISMIADEENDPLEMIHAFTGIHLERDLFDHLGNTMGWYASDSTGGGGLMSSVLFLEVTDEAGLGGTLEYILGTLDDLAATNIDGRFEARAWRHGEATCSTLTFPGWPVPIEPSLAIHDGFLFVTLSPQALTAALDQRASGGPGLAANARFRAGVVGSLDDLTSLSFTDNTRRIQEGYGFATLVTAALANGVRTPENPVRDPGMVLPPFNELVRGSRATVNLGRIEGNDLVAIGTGDPSMAANFTSLCGSPLVQLIGIGLMVAIPMGVMWTVPMMGMASAPPFAIQEVRASAEEGEMLRLLEALEAAEEDI